MRDRSWSWPLPAHARRGTDADKIAAYRFGHEASTRAPSERLFHLLEGVAAEMRKHGFGATWTVVSSLGRREDGMKSDEIVLSHHPNSAM